MEDSGGSWPLIIMLDLGYDATFGRWLAETSCIQQILGKSVSSPVQLTWGPHTPLLALTVSTSVWKTTTLLNIDKNINDVVCV